MRFVGFADVNEEPRIGSKDKAVMRRERKRNAQCPRCSVLLSNGRLKLRKVQQRQYVGRCDPKDPSERTHPVLEWSGASTYRVHVIAFWQLGRRVKCRRKPGLHASNRKSSFERLLDNL